MRYSIIVPVFNGGEYLKICLESILKQKHDDFAVEILDSGSTDGSLAYTRQLADPRIRVWPTDRRLSIEENWQRILTVPRSEFMTIVGQDDLLNPEFLSEIEALITEHPRATLYQTHFEMIDAHGRPKRFCRPIPSVEKADEFLAQRFLWLRDSYVTGYVMRSADYDSIGGIPLYHNLLYADDALFYLLMKRGYKATSPRSCFSYRQHEKSVSGSMQAGDLVKSFRGYQELLLKERDSYEPTRRVCERYLADYLKICFTIEMDLAQNVDLSSYQKNYELIRAVYIEAGLPCPFVLRSQRNRIVKTVCRIIRMLIPAGIYDLMKKAFEQLPRKKT